MKIIYYSDWKTLFYCQDKNASTTIESRLKELTSTLPVTYWDESTIEPSPQQRLDSLRNKPRDFHFTVVRNTWDRLASLYHMLRHQLDKEWPAKPKGRLNPWFSRYEESLLKCLRGEEPFDAFIRFVCSQADDEVDSHWQPQTAHLPLDDPSFYVARFERLNEDWNIISERMGVSSDPLPVSANRTAHSRSHYANDYSESSYRLVLNRYAHEIEVFGFAFGPKPAAR